MEIENEKGIFDLGDEKITIERTNPLLNEQGSLSLTYPIKLTKKNDWLLDFPSKFARLNKYNIKTDVNIRAGLLNENATLQMTSVDSEQVEATFLLYESTFYSRIKDIKLPEIFSGKERWFDDKSVSRDDRIKKIVSVLKTKIFSQSDLSDDFTLFPVFSKTNTDVNVDENYSIRPTAVVDRMDVINEIYDEQNVGDTGGRPIEIKNKFRPESSYTYTDADNNQITVPIGYGCSIFFRFGYILREIFNYFGFHLEENIFDFNNDFRRIVVLNNTQDAIMLGFVKEDQCVPDITVNDFFEVIREGLNADFFIDVPSKKAKLIYFNDVLDSTPDLDLTSFLSGEVEITFSRPKQVKLSVGKELENGNTEKDTLTEFKKSYGDLYKTPHRGMSDGVFHFEQYNQIIKMKLLGSITSRSYSKVFLSSMNFDYYVPEDLPSVEIEEHQLSGNIPVIQQFKGGYIGALIGEFRNLNTTLVVNNTKTEKKEVSNCHYIIAIESFTRYFRIPMITEIDEDGNSLYYFADHFPYSNLISLHTFGKFGLFNTFWKKYDSILRNSWHTITGRYRIPANVLQSWRFDKLKLLHGQPVIANKISYELTDDPVIDCEIELKTVKEYK